MIQDIGAGRYHNEYRQAVPKRDSCVLCYRKNELLVRIQDEGISFLTYGETVETAPEAAGVYTYLFSIDGRAYFLVPELSAEQFPGTEWMPVSGLRRNGPKEAAFAGVTGYQLWGWYSARRFCPACGKAMVPDERERMMKCPACGQTEYPKICPAVIVAVTHGDRLLLTKYAGRDFKKYALIAGFAEIGETIEETVQREVMEETGLRVKNLKYYKSQPWSFTDTLLFGFFAELDGDETIHLDEHELSLARWCTRDEIPENDGISLTREMMQVFKDGGPWPDR